MTPEDARARLEAERERHRQRSRPARILTVLGGGLVGLVGAVLLVLFPELGLPLMLVGLRLLALEYEWAARAYVPVARFWDRVKGLSTPWKIASAAVAAVVVAAIVWWIV